ncbi:MAG: hypothetical protein KDA87_14470 [Planctomycetales bacterium]|nr:hypothetical protein [Planctomycetales bacterium]
MTRYSVSFRSANKPDQPRLSIYWRIRKLFLVAILTAVTPLALQAQEESPAIANPPRILLATRITDDDQLELVTYQTIYIGFDGSSYNHRSLQKISLQDVRITKLDGTEWTEWTPHEARQQLATQPETPVLALAWNQPLAKQFKTFFAKDVLLFTFPKQAPVWKEPQDPSRPLR